MVSIDSDSRTFGFSLSSEFVNVDDCDGTTYAVGNGGSELKLLRRSACLQGLFDKYGLKKSKIQLAYDDQKGTIALTVTELPLIGSVTVALDKKSCAEQDGDGADDYLLDDSDDGVPSLDEL